MSKVKSKNILGNFEFQFKIFLYLLVIIVIMAVGQIMYFSTAYTNHLKPTVPSTPVQNGIINLTDYNIAHIKPIQLEGEWRKYPNVYFTKEEVNYDMLQNYELYNLPIYDLSSATGTATYQIYINFNIDKTANENIVLSIPFLKSDAKIYVNGKLVEKEDSSSYWDVGTKYSALYDLEEYFDYYAEYQEIVISTNKGDFDTDLYNRDLFITTKSNMLAYQNNKYTLEYSLLGIIIVIILISVNYIISRPYYNISTFINLFDIFLLLNILFTLTNLPNIFTGSMSDFNLSDIQIYKLSIVSLFIMLTMLNCLNQVLFDPHKKCPSFFDIYLNIIYISCAVCYVIYPYLYAYLGIYSLIVVIALTIIGSIVRYINLIKDKKATPYLHFQFFLTQFVSIIICLGNVDFLFNLPLSRLYIIISYVVIILVHLSVRAYESRKPFIKITALNNDLECKIKERTSQLTKANEELQEIATKDSLTKTYNRLHFENVLVKELEHFKENYRNLATLHLAMFDLDNFKKINDTFGHPEGDQQLIDVASIVDEVVPSDVVFARIGGEEFVLLFVDYDDDEVFEFVEVIRCSLERVSFKNKNRTTGSFGVARAYPDYDRKRFFAITDDCLYHSKMHGKNCISHYVDGQIVIKKSDEINI